MSDERTPLIAYAREVVEGDVVDGRTVEKVSHKGDTVILSRKSAGDTEYGADDEVQIRRLVDGDALAAGWVRDGAAYGTPEALALLKAARGADPGEETEA